jgi:hypothetical protein
MEKEIDASIRDQSSADSKAGGWTKIERKRKQISVTPIADIIRPFKHFWCGFTPMGREKWFIELTNGRIVSGDDENYHYWLRRCHNQEDVK